MDSFAGGLSAKEPAFNSNEVRKDNNVKRFKLRSGKW
jgi:hypothetical protein